MGKAVTISKDFGCGALEMAKTLAAEMGYEYIDKALILELAKKMKTSCGEISSFEDGKSLAMFKFVSKYMTSAHVKKILSDDLGYVDDSSYCSALEGMMGELADRGNVVIVGRGGQCILHGREDVIHVRCIAPLDYKKIFLAEKQEMTRPEAESLIQEKEEQSRKYIEKLFSRYINDPTLYHITFNMAEIPQHSVVSMIRSLL